MDKIRVIITNKQKEVKIPTGLRMLVRRCCNAVLRLEEFKGPAEISVTFVDNAQIKEYNKQYRDKDMVTDVLSFGMGENGVYDTDPETGAQILGDVVISMEKRRSRQDALTTACSGRLGTLRRILCCTFLVMTMKTTWNGYVCAKRKSLLWISWGSRRPPAM